MFDKKLLEEVLATAMRSGADFAEIYGERTRNNSVRFLDGKIDRINDNFLSQNSRLEPSPAFGVSLPFSTNPIFSSQRWNSGIAVFPVSSRRAAVSRKPVVW